MKWIIGSSFRLVLIIGSLNGSLCKDCLMREIETTGVIEKLESAVDAWSLLSRIFEYEASVTLINGSSTDEDSETYDVLVRLIREKLNFPVSVVDIDEPEIKLQPSAFAKSSYFGTANMSYMLLVTDKNSLHRFIHESSNTFNSPTLNINTRARFVIFSSGISFSDMDDILRAMWTKYQINKVIAYDYQINKVVAFNFLEDLTKVFDVKDVDRILEYTYASKKNLHGYPIRVLMTQTPPASIAIPNSTRFRGVNQNILDVLEKLMNFTAVMTKPDFRSGVFGPAIYREVELIANMQFITSHNENGFEFTTPFFSERIHFVVPKAERVPIWLSMYHVFHYSIWIPTGCLFAVCVTLWLCILKFHRGNSHNDGMDVAVMTVIYVLFLLTNGGLSRRLRNCSERFLVLSGSIFGIIMVNTFTGHLFKSFSRTYYYPEIDSLEALGESGLPLTLAAENLVSAVSGSEDPRLNNLLSKMNTELDARTAFDVENEGNRRAVLSRLTRIKYELARNMIENNGSRSFHMANEHLGQYSMGFIVPRGSIFLRDFNSHINAILESGLIQKWYYDSTFNYTLWMRIKESISGQNLPRPFSLSDLRLAWFVLASGMAISFVSFLIEIACGNRKGS